LKKLHILPHRVCESTCYVNGLEDILTWKGAAYSDFLLSVIGGMAGFTYLRFKRADPPCMGKIRKARPVPMRSTSPSPMNRVTSNIGWLLFLFIPSSSI